MKLDLYLAQYTKVHSETIMGQNVRVRTIKLIEENIGVNCCDLGLSNGFLICQKHKQNEIGVHKR